MILFGAHSGLWGHAHKQRNSYRRLVGSLQQQQQQHPLVANKEVGWSCALQCAGDVKADLCGGGGELKVKFSSRCCGQTSSFKMVLLNGFLLRENMHYKWKMSGARWRVLCCLR